MRCLLIAGLVALPLAAQIGTPYPGGGGPYPNGGGIPGQGRYPNGNPNGGVGVGRPGRTTREKDSKTPAIVTTTEGTLRRVLSTQIVIEAGDHRIVWYRTTSTTTYSDGTKDLDPKTLTPGDQVSIDSSADDQDIFTAVSLTRHAIATLADRQKAESRQWDLPPLSSTQQVAKAGGPAPIVRDPGDDRPILRRQRPADDQPAEQPPEEQPAPQATAQTAPAPQAAPAQAEPQEPEDTRAATTMKPTNAQLDPDDPGRPVLRRGGAATRRVASDGQVNAAPPKPAATQQTPAAGPAARPAPSLSASVKGPIAVEPPATPAAAPAVGFQEDPIIEKARAEVDSYEQGLPNFFAKQFTTRYFTENVKQGWQAQDVVTADIAYEEGRESYKNIKIGNKATNKSMDEIPGARSTGEFATLLNQVMGGGATFRKAGSDTIRGRSVYVYKFEITRELSRWRIEAPSELYYPAYRGTLYIDRDTNRVLRIEQEGRNMPLLFPFDTVETTADYDFVRLETQSFLLPVESEVLSCQRGTRSCSRNKIEFRNYRKFGAESDITFSEK